MAPSSTVPWEGTDGKADTPSPHGGHPSRPDLDNWSFHLMELDFTDRSGECARAVEAIRNAGYWLDDRQIGASFGRVLPPTCADLLTIALCCYTADRTFPRGRDWRRDLSLRIPVIDQTAWRSTVGRLESWLTLLTGDEWQLRLVSRRAARGSESQLVLELPEDAPRAAALFSGGLDSYAGAGSWLERDKTGVLVLVGVQSSTVVGAVQRRLFRRLSDAYPGRVRFVAVPLHLSHSVSRDSWQRTRGFVYHALVSSVAHVAQAPDAIVFENGYGALNPRLGEQQRGAQTTKSTHPWVVSGWSQISDLLGLEPRTTLPHRWQTKAEVLAAMPSGLWAGIRETESCDAFPLRRRLLKQCGECGSCILRRQALIAAGLAYQDRTDYAKDPLGPNDLTRLMAYQAWQFRSITTADWGRVELRWPEVTLGRTGQLPIDVELDLDLLRRYASEWGRIARMDPQRGAAFAWPS